VGYIISSLSLAVVQFTSSRIMILAKETEREKDIPKSRESVYLLLDLVCVFIVAYS